MAKLTEAQRKVLARMEAGDAMYGYEVSVHHSNMEFVIYNDDDDDDVFDIPAVTADMLINGGHVKGARNPVARAWHYEITDAGRAALEQE